MTASTAESLQPPARPSFRERYAAAPWNWLGIVMVSAFHVLAFAALTQPLSWRVLALMAFVYAWSVTTTSLYLHRSLSHRSVTLARPLRLFFALGTCLNLAGDPVGWVGVHRQHHGATDTDDDVHSPRHGLWHAHFGWIAKLTMDMQADLRALATDVRQDTFCRWLENPAIYGACHLALAGAVYAGFGLPGLLWGFYLPSLLVVHVTATVNSLCHHPRFGYRRFETREDSRNVRWLALATLGDSFHNNHHAQPRRVRHGLDWTEPDPTQGLVWLLERLGLAKDVAWARSPANQP